ncbi:hypothetical protein GPECTOR_8g396 [Gonium pectorale]|uniref:Alpha-1,3-mannosyltransferase CMT1 n=1 Tax=Gonium pectorale TaxID=33097 RepID=A0A150GT36_GONPE|nr:hypothetical protein GPECTOR_8g396 [Gonium pectorale]|eukprot:KXZ53029.1 hypothetical protein GPECTOR_8g396 [Gonium pectorale]
MWQSQSREYNRTGVCDGGCFFAGNLRDAQLVMPNYISHLTRVVSTLSEAHNPVFVSIYESGSSDRTRAWLKVLAIALDALGVPHELKLGGTIQRAKGEERIHFLARVRSAALEPLYGRCAANGTFCVPKMEAGTKHHHHQQQQLPHAGAGSGSGRVVFLNDILFTAADVLRLLQYPADLACGLDLGMAAEPDLTWAEHHDTIAAFLRARWWLPRRLARALSRAHPLRMAWRSFHRKSEPLLREYGPLFFYDKWVARDISGRMFTNREPFVAYDKSVARVRAGRPVRVHCCWNGLAVITAGPLVGREVEFREHREGECSASECSLLCDDMWRLGYGNMIMDPNVRVTYDRAGARRLFREFASDLPANVPGIAYARFRPGDVAEALALPLHDDASREYGGEGAGRRAGGGPRLRVVDCCDLKKGADMVEFRDAGVCHRSNVSIL